MTTISRAPTQIFEQCESSVRSYCRRIDSVWDQAHGSFLVDIDGREYIDFLAGAGSLNYGHNDPDLCARLVAHIERKGISHSLDFHTREKGRFLETFQQTILEPRNLDYRVQFTGPTGTNSVEAAIKLARKVSGRHLIVAFTNGFHGVTMGSLAVTGSRHLRSAVSSGLGGVARLPYDGYLGDGFDSADLLERMLDDPSSGLDSPAAILLETVQGEGGLNAASAGWLRRVAELAKRHDALLIVDDIQAGCGRTGTFFSFEPAGIVPDIVTLSKSLSGAGLPMAVALVKPDRDGWAPGEHNGTFRGPNHSFVTATAALEKFWTTTVFQHDVERRARLVTERLAEIARQFHGWTVKGRGMMAGIDVHSTVLADRIALRAFRNGLVIETCGPRDEVVKVMAPLTTPDDVLNEGLDRLARSIDEVCPTDV